ncbi:MAG: diguanylate cyclase [Gemmatimonadaceae bacterium]|nr:diguanylate cyclase [Gemmatimonadaceae bacterium]
MTTRSSAPLVLLVDDDRMVRLLARQALERAGFRVEEAETGVVAVRLFDRYRPDLIVLDVMMPEQDGFETCEIIRARPLGSYVPILMTTASDDVGSIHRAYEVGATDFINKPLPWALLGYRVQYLLRSSLVLNALAQSEERLRAAQQVARLGYWEWDLEADRVLLSDMSCKLLGISPAETVTFQSIVAAIHVEDQERIRIAIRTATAGWQALNLEFRPAHSSDLEPIWIHAQATLSTPHHKLSGTFQDISIIKRSEAQTRYLAYFDSLTGLPNRVSQSEQLSQWLSSARRHGRIVAVLLLDLDNFKQINETLGHEAGDRLLALFAARLRHCVRHEDAVGTGVSGANDIALARMGGDEFTVLLGDLASAEAAHGVAERILESAREPIVVDGHDVVINASVGISTFPLDGDDANVLLANADTAMYHAKDAGGNRVAFYNKPMRAAATERFSLEMALRPALERNQFMLQYQPKLDLASETDHECRSASAMAPPHAWGGITPRVHSAR